MGLLDRYKSLEDMKCKIMIRTEVQGNVDVTEVHFAMKKPSKYRTEDSDVINVSNGETTWVYDKNTGETKTGDVSGAPQSVFDYQNMVKSKLEKSNKEYLGDGKIEGRDCFIVKLVPLEGHEDAQSEQIIWVDKEFWYPLKIEMKEGAAHMTLEYTDLKLNSGLSDDIFELEAPEG